MQGCTSGQLALAWVLAQGDDVIPIPGESKLLSVIHQQVFTTRGVLFLGYYAPPVSFETDK